MRFYKYSNFLAFLFFFLFIISAGVLGQNRDDLPSEFREYTNPEEVVTFDRTTTFKRAVDVINTFAQEHRDKIILDKSGTEGTIGISVPAMHWFDALKLILRANDLVLNKEKDIYEIVTIESQKEEEGSGQVSTGGGKEEGEILATTDTYEVRINAVFFEGNRRALKEIGVDWSTISENVPSTILGGGQGSGGGGGGGQGGGGEQGPPQVPNSQFNSSGPFVQVNSKGAQSVSQNVFNSLINFGEIGDSGIEVQALFSAFEADNLGEILASPTVKVQDGEDGRIQVGQDFSIKQRDIAGNVVEDFFSVGTILEVTPNVIKKKDTTFIHLDIKAERSTAQPDPVSTIINKQEAETQSLLLDGETTVIAGLYSTEQSEVRRGIPILKDLPPWFFGLRYLFGYNSKDRQSRELVIMLKATLEPRISERMDKGEFENKYEILRDERRRMRREIKESRKARETDTGNDFDELDESDQQGEQVNAPAPEPEMEGENEQKEETKVGNEEDTAEQEKQKMNKQQENEEEPPIVNDTEVESKEVQLNLGADVDEAEQDEPEKDSLNQGMEKDPMINEDQQMDADTAGSQQMNAGAENTQQEQQAVSSQTHYIIAGSFSEMENAKVMKDSINNEGYNGMIFEKPDGELFLVSYDQYDDLEKAQAALQEIQKEENAKAWLYSTQ